MPRWVKNPSAAFGTLGADVARTISPGGPGISRCSSPSSVSPGRHLISWKEALTVSPIEIWLSTRLYAPLAMAIWVLAWSLLKDDPRVTGRGAALTGTVRD